MQKEIVLRSIDDFYGYRPGPSEPRLFYLNAWEFLMWWEVLPRGRVAEEYVQPGSCYVLFPNRPGTEILHEHWILHKRSRPMVPAPGRTRMPEQIAKDPAFPAHAKQERGRLFSVYMRPWTLCSEFACDHVPLLRDLNVVPGTAISSDAPRTRMRKKMLPAWVCRRNFAEAWQWYLRGNIVSRHQQRIIVQFMSLNCGRSSTRDVESEAKPRRLPHEDDNALSNNALCVERVHNVITEMVQKSGRLPDVEAADTCTHHAGNNALALGASLWGPATKAWREGDTTAARLVAEGMHGVSEAAADKKAMPQNVSKEMKANVYVKHKALSLIHI